MTDGKINSFTDEQTGFGDIMPVGGGALVLFTKAVLVGNWSQLFVGRPVKYEIYPGTTDASIVVLA